MYLTRPDIPSLLSLHGPFTDKSFHYTKVQRTLPQKWLPRVFWGPTSHLGSPSVATQLPPLWDANPGHFFSEFTAVQFDEGPETVHITADTFLFSCILTFPLVYICILLFSMISFRNYKNISLSSSLTEWFFLYYPPIPLMTFQQQATCYLGFKTHSAACKPLSRGKIFSVSPH